MTETIMYNGRLIFPLPDDFIKLTTDETEALYGDALYDHTFACKARKAYINMKLNNFRLKPEDVETRITDYYKMYAGLIPDVKMGELQLLTRDRERFGILTFQAKSTSGEAYNFVTITGMTAQELLMILTCEMKDVVYFYQEFIRIVKQIRFISESAE